MIGSVEELTFGIVGNSQPVRELHKSIVAVAHVSFPVLICGETGTGKELVANAIHRLSGRNQLVAVDCTGLSGELFSSELFGHERGAFTGASSRRIGLVECAGTGTIFLDEIGDLDFALQARLLRFLQESAFRRLGSNVTVRSMCRVLAATNRDLEQEVRVGRFRPDLYERLRVLEVKVPSLRNRIKDLPDLISHFQQKHQFNLCFDSEAMLALQSYRWRGNIRSLEHLVIRLGTTRSHSLVTGEDIRKYHRYEEIRDAEIQDAEIQDAEIRARYSMSSRGVPAADSVYPSLSLKDIEQKHIVDVLRLSSGNLARAAQALGIGRTTLYRRLREIKGASDPMPTLIE